MERGEVIKLYSDTERFSNEEDREDYLVSHLEMDDLEQLVRLMIRGEEDFEFLPASFWVQVGQYYYFNGRKPGRYFSKKYTFYGRIIEKTDEEDGWMEYGRRNVDFDFRTRFEKVVEKIGNECLEHEGPITDEIAQKMLFLKHVFTEVFLNEGPESPGEQLRKRMSDIQTVAETVTVGEFGNNFEKVLQGEDIRDNPILLLRQRLLSDDNFRRLVREYEKTNEQENGI